eukprot:TRINITY_DN27414_c0_g1_i1.p1 TRINITY_DN27414_c0_g1~~TRINITY_DN27414_c0_g1_i1.p1  ORF type:complete len:955 (+),score=98.12 TRINITY_DN27414_c0_g1_i1:312-2867(+)
MDVRGNQLLSPLNISSMVPTSLEPRGAVLLGSSVYFCEKQLSRIVKVDTTAGTLATVAGGHNTFLDGYCQTARLWGPADVAVEETSEGVQVFVADALNNAVRKIVKGPVEGRMETLVGGPVYQGAKDQQQPLVLNNPQSVALDGDSLYVCDTDNHRIVQLLSSSSPSVIAGRQGSPGSIDGEGLTARFSFPRDMAVLTNETLYVLDDNGIKAIDIETKIVTTITLLQAGQPLPQNAANPSTSTQGQGTEDATQGTTNSAPADANNNTPSGSQNDITAIALSAFDDRIIMYIATKTALLRANVSLQSNVMFTEEISVATNAAWVTSITRLTVLGNRLFYVRENDHRIFSLNLESDEGVVSISSGSEQPGSRFGELSDALYNNPRGLAVNTNGDLYIADYGNNLIVLQTPNGVNAFCVVSEHTTNTDEQGPKARFLEPADLTWTGEVFLIADAGNKAIRSMSMDGQVSTLVKDLPEAPLCITVADKTAYFTTSSKVYRVSIASKSYTELDGITVDTSATTGSCMGFHDKQLYVVDGSTSHISLLARKADKVILQQYEISRTKALAAIAVSSFIPTVTPEPEVAPLLKFNVLQTDNTEDDDETDPDDTETNEADADSESKPDPASTRGPFIFLSATGAPPEQDQAAKDTTAVEVETGGDDGSAAQPAAGGGDGGTGDEAGGGEGEAKTEPAEGEKNAEGGETTTETTLKIKLQQDSGGATTESTGDSSANGTRSGKEQQDGTPNNGVVTENKQTEVKPLLLRVTAPLLFECTHTISKPEVPPPVTVQPKKKGKINIIIMIVLIVAGVALCVVLLGCVISLIRHYFHKCPCVKARDKKPSSPTRKEKRNSKSGAL